MKVKPHEMRVIHQSRFVPPVPAGNWEVYAILRPTSRERAKLRKTDSGVFIDLITLTSGKVSLAIEKSEYPNKTGAPNAAEPRR